MSGLLEQTEWDKLDQTASEDRHGPVRRLWGMEAGDRRVSAAWYPGMAAMDLPVVGGLGVVTEEIISIFSNGPAFLQGKVGFCLLKINSQSCY